MVAHRRCINQDGQRNQQLYLQWAVGEGKLSDVLLMSSKTGQSYGHMAFLLFFSSYETSTCPHLDFNIKMSRTLSSTSTGSACQAMIDCASRKAQEEHQQRAKRPCFAPHLKSP